MARNYILGGLIPTYVQETTNDQFIVNGTFLNETDGGAGTQNVTGALFTNTNTFYGATVTATYTVTGGLFTNAQTFYQATVSQDGAPQAITGALYTNDQTFYGATIANVDQFITGALFTNSQIFYSGTVSGGVVAAPQVDNYYYAPSREAVQRMLDILYRKKPKRKENKAKRIERMAVELINEFDPGPDLPPLDLSALRNAIVMLDEPIRINRSAPDETRKQVIVKLYEKAAAIHRKNIEDDDEEVLEMALRAMLN
jgi:hypothetical protein